MHYDRNTGTVIAAGKSVRLPGQERLLFEALAAASLTHVDIIRLLWQGSPPASAKNAVYVIINHLNRRLAPVGLAVEAEGTPRRYRVKEYVAAVA